MTKPLSDADQATIENELFAGKKISAIKLYRGFTGAGLKEAKESVEALETALRMASPEKFTVSPSKGGCVSVMLLLLLPFVLLGSVMTR